MHGNFKALLNFRLSIISGKRRIHIPLLKLITSAMKLFTI